MAKKVTTRTRKVLRGKEKDFKTLSEAHAALSKKYKLTRGMANLFLNSLDMKRNVEAAMDFFIEASNAEAGSILLIDGDKQDMYFAAARGTKADEIKLFRLPLGKGIGGACAENKETIAVSDVRKDARFSKEIDQALGFETRSILAVPLVFKNTSLGAVEVINKRGSDVFTADEIALCQDIARFLAVLLVIGDRLSV